MTMFGPNISLSCNPNPPGSQTCNISSFDKTFFSGRPPAPQPPMGGLPYDFAHTNGPGSTAGFITLCGMRAQCDYPHLSGDATHAMMITRRSLLAGALALALPSPALALQRAAIGPPPRLIIDEDWGDDVDCAGALALAMTQVKAGNCVIDSLMSTGPNQSGPSFADTCARWSGHEVPVYFDATDYPCKGPNSGYPRTITSTFGTAFGIGGNSCLQYADTTMGYRRQLAQMITRNQRCRIMTAGGLSSLANLMRSERDSISPLTGMQLIAAAVELLVVMGGYKGAGREYNFALKPAATAYVVNNWVGPIYGVDFGLGNFFLYNPSTSPDTNPFSDAYQIAAPGERPAWDVVTMAIAIFGPGFSFYTFQPGRQVIDTATGANTWRPDPAGNYFYGSLKAPLQTTRQWLSDQMNFNG